MIFIYIIVVVVVVVITKYTLKLFSSNFNECTSVLRT